MILEEVASSVEAIKNTATKVAQAGNKDLVRQGIITPDGVIDFAKYAEARGASTNIGQILAQATVGTTKQQVAGSIAGLLLLLLWLWLMKVRCLRLRRRLWLTVSLWVCCLP